MYSMKCALKCDLFSDDDAYNNVMLKIYSVACAAVKKQGSG